MLARGESTWIAENLQSNTPLQFSLRKTAVSGSSGALSVDSFAVLTVRNVLSGASGIFAKPTFNSSSDLLAAKEEERRHMAMELHDGIGQSLAVIKISLENLQQQMKSTLDHQSIKQMNNILYHIHGSMEDVHRLSTDLSPRYLDSRSLTDALEYLCNDLQHAWQGTTIKYDVNDVAEDLTNPLKLAVFRTVQEALSNALKYSQANTIRVSLRESADQLFVEVADDGIGFDVAEELQQGTGRGLAGIQERVKISNGSVVITSGASKGTSISMTWPCNSYQVPLSD
jgi:signal transduction histidine kinase